VPPAASTGEAELELGRRSSHPGAERLSAPSEARASDPSAKLGDPFGIVGTVQAGTFQVEKVVAHGGFGVIYRAKHAGFRAPVALKCLKIPETLTGAERDQFLERFRAEGEVMFRLSTSIPEVVRPLQVDFMKLPKGAVVPFIALEWLEGETLKDLIVRRLEAGKAPIRIERAVPYLTPVARALSRAHRFPGPDGQPLAIVHCDLKPDNVFVVRMDGGEAFKIFDFGIAKVRLAATREAGGLTKAGSNMFTPAYAAPEQWAPDRFGQTGPWTDVYAFALTLTELVTQRPAIDGSPASMLRQALDEANRPTPRRRGLDIPDAVDRVFEAALAVSPKNRTQSVEAFWSALEDALQLPQSFAGRSSVAAMPAVSLGIDDDPPPQRAPQSAPARPAAARAASPGFGDFELGELPGAAPPPSALGSAAVSASPGAALAAAPAPAPFPAHTEPPPAPLAPPPPNALTPPVAVARNLPPPDGAAARGPLDSDALVAGSLSLEIDRPAEPPVALARPAPSGVPASGAPPPPGAPPPAPQSAGGMSAAPGGGTLLYPQEADPTEAPPAPVSARLGAAASKAGVVASKAGVVAAGAAKSLAQKALSVEQHQRIQLDKPETWLKPMLAPMIVMGAAVVITIGAIIANRFLEEQIKVSWISAPLIVIAVAFAVYRWIKLQEE
jgi:serine/threonine-protein kinase